MRAMGLPYTAAHGTTLGSLSVAAAHLPNRLKNRQEAKWPKMESRQRKYI
jgi:lambda repressor-like predicted transcriptional regulator